MSYIYIYIYVCVCVCHVLISFNYVHTLGIFHLQLQPCLLEAEFIVAPLDVLKDPPVHFWLEGSAPSGR